MPNEQRLLAHLVNLKDTILDHKQYCNHDCAVSITLLKETMQFIADSMTFRDERQRILVEEILESVKGIH